MSVSSVGKLQASSYSHDFFDFEFPGTQKSVTYLIKSPVQKPVTAVQPQPTIKTQPQKTAMDDPFGFDLLSMGAQNPSSNQGVQLQGNLTQKTAPGPFQPQNVTSTIVGIDIGGQKAVNGAQKVQPPNAPAPPKYNMDAFSDLF